MERDAFHSIASGEGTYSDFQGVCGKGRGAGGGETPACSCAFNVALYGLTFLETTRLFVARRIPRARAAKSVWDNGPVEREGREEERTSLSFAR